MAIEEENRVISFFHFNCTPSAKPDEITEARLTALRNHKQQPIALDVYSADESDILSDFNDEDKKAIEQTEALDSQQREELLQVYSEFAQQVSSTSADKTVQSALPPLSGSSQAAHSPTLQSPPPSQTFPVPPPHRGRGRPPKNPAQAGFAATPLNGLRTPISEEPGHHGFPPGAMPPRAGDMAAFHKSGGIGLNQRGPPVGNNVLAHGGMIAGPPQPPPIALNSATIPAVAANVSSPALYAQQRELPPSMTVPPPLPPCPWFDPTAISQEEANELATAFPLIKQANPVDPSNLAAVAYLQLRNTLIDVYRQNPTQKLTLAECRKHCDGDLSVVIRMLSFLERNRLINYALSPNPTAPGTGGAANLLSSGVNGSSVMDPVTRKLKDELRDHWTRTPTCTACDRICLYSFYILSPNVYGSMLPLSHLHPAVWCSDCAREAPHNQCLLKVNLPPLHVSGGASSWSEQQINVLFDAIEAHVPDWLTISRIVSRVPGNPTRSPSECLAVFLSMPLAENPGCVTPSTAADTTTSPATDYATSQLNAASATAPMSTELTAMEVLLNAVDLLSKNARTNDDPARSSLMTELGRSAEGRLNHLKQGPSQETENTASVGRDVGSFQSLSTSGPEFGVNRQLSDSQQQQQSDSHLSRLHNSNDSSAVSLIHGNTNRDHSMGDDPGSGMWSEVMVAHPGLTRATTTTVGEERSIGMDEPAGVIVSSNSGGTSTSAGTFLGLGTPSPGASDVTMNAAEVTLDSMLNDVPKT